MFIVEYNNNIMEVMLYGSYYRTIENVGNQPANANKVRVKILNRTAGLTVARVLDLTVH